MHRRLRLLASILALAWLLAMLPMPLVTVGAETDLLPTNDRPELQIRFTNPEQAQQRRRRLIEFIWPDGLPLEQLPKIRQNIGLASTGDDLERLDPQRFNQVDRLEADVDGMVSVAYLLHPRSTGSRQRLVIVHEGHAPRGRQLQDGIDDAVHYFLSQGCFVCIMQMPLYGWNDDDTLLLTAGAEASSGQPSEAPVERHDDIFDAFTAHGRREVEAMHVFLEPVVAAINHWCARTDSDDIVMIGLSGGGWTTHMMAAVDTRIDWSIPVAGSFPLYLRNRDPGSVGDREQVIESLFAEDVAPDGGGGGVATWLEIYTLGGFGRQRRQSMVTAEFDSCCFSGRGADSFKDVVSESVARLGMGQWTHALDSSHHSHQISPWVLENIVRAASGEAAQ